MIAHSGTPQFYDPPWKKGDLIRNIKTGQPYLVIHLYLHTATMIVEANEPSPTRTPFIILPADYPNYAPDNNFIEKKGHMVYEQPVQFI